MKVYLVCWWYEDCAIFSTFEEAKTYVDKRCWDRRRGKYDPVEIWECPVPGEVNDWEMVWRPEKER